MKIVQAQKLLGQPWEYRSERTALTNPLVLVFADRLFLEKDEILDEIKEEFPYDQMVFASASGEISGTQVNDNSVVVTAIEFEKAAFLVERANILTLNKDSRELGSNLMARLPLTGLKHLFILTDANHVQVGALINGIESVLNQKVAITGGVCSDSPRFQRTVLSYNSTPIEGEVIVIGFYGESLEITYASCGGWIPFGPERTITKCKGNVVHEFDDRPALKIYTDYLGSMAKKLPDPTVTFPLNITENSEQRPVVRGIVSVDRSKNSITLAEDIALNSKAQLMTASVDSIVAGAHEAANMAMKNRMKKPQVALVVSCSGRKAVMQQRVEEEIEEVSYVFGEDVPVVGFYSAGELAPFHNEKSCILHNQTMTLTLISE